MRQSLLLMFLAYTLFALPTDAYAARLWSSGCELQSFGDTETNGDELEWVAGGAQIGALSVSTSVFHSGLASCRINTTGGNYEYAYHDLTSAAGNGPYYARVYVYFGSAPASTNQFWTPGSTGDDEGAIGIGSDMKLRLYTDDMTTVRATASSALSTGTWYRIEWYYEVGGSSEVRVDGVQVLLDAAQDGDGFTSFTLCSCGINFGGLNGDFYFDDYAVNDTTGGSQNSWPGAGNIVHMQPDSAGDNNNCSAGGYDHVDEVVPDDVTTICTLATDGGGDTLDVNTELSSGAGIDTYDTVSLVQVGVREAAASAASEGWNLRLKSASGGSVTSGTATTHNDTGYKSNGDATPRNYKLTSYTDPTTGIAWTPTGTNSLDNMQIGITTTDGAPNVLVSTLWALVEYVDGSPPAVTERMRARIQNTRFKVSGGRFKLQSN